MSRWRLDTVRVGHFRGVAQERVFRFEGLPALLHGNNGAGKSTLAQALQWVLYGAFPDGVLRNNSYDKFLIPVDESRRKYYGEVIFRRGAERLVIRRSVSTNTFSLTLGEHTFEHERAERERDELLGIQMDTFVRAVLLHQSRIRGLLLDEPKAKNDAMDRLLGVEEAAGLFQALKPKEFADAAKARREKAEQERRTHEANEQLLRDQLQQAQERAREAGFLNQDFNAAGLQAAYAALWEELRAIGERHSAPAGAFPGCADARAAQALAGAVARAASGIQQTAQVQVRLAARQVELAQWQALLETWRKLAAAARSAEQELAQAAARYGKREVLVQERALLEGEAAQRAEELKLAGALRQLLVDARALVERRNAAECPVCERAAPESFRATLDGRIAALASEQIGALETRQAAIRKRLEEIAAAEREFVERAARVAEAQARLERHIATLPAPVPGANKIEALLEQGVEQLRAECEQLRGAAGSLAKELEAVTLRNTVIGQALAPVLGKRDELAAHEKNREKLKARHAADERAAARLDRLAAQLERVRKALLEAKDGLARERLEAARPRALELYRRLVRHPVFDTFQISTTQKAQKVDYNFEVLARGESGTAREARLVLSDGQITATALGLFFALAESAGHGLEVLFIDDPTQNLDLPCKEQMAALVTEIARERQVIVATHDEDFVSFLKSAGFTAGALTYKLEKWDGNPTVSVTGPALGAAE